MQIRKVMHGREEPMQHGGTENEVKYKVTVETGDVKNGGTDSNVDITVIGTEGTTHEHNLDVKFVDDFERGSKRTYEFDCVILPKK